MNYSRVVLTVAGWEERFLKGIVRFLEQNTSNELVVIEYIEYRELVAENLRLLAEYVKEKNVKCTTLGLKFGDPIFNWRTLQGLREQYGSTSGGCEIVVDSTTMPRDTIFSVLTIFKNYRRYFLYNFPIDYANGWLSKDLLRPRLLFGMSGIFQGNRPTALMLVSGFDVVRTIAIIKFYEPKRVFVGLQTGEQYENQVRNVQAHLNQLKSHLNNIEYFDIDAYSFDHGFAKLEGIALNLIQENDVIVSSLGPKPTSIAVCKLVESHPEIAVSYLPTTTYNPDYSHGISESYFFEEL